MRTPSLLITVVAIMCCVGGCSSDGWGPGVALSLESAFQPLDFLYDNAKCFAERHGRWPVNTAELKAFEQAEGLEMSVDAFDRVDFTLTPEGETRVEAAWVPPNSTNHLAINSVLPPWSPAAPEAR